MNAKHVLGNCIVWLVLVMLLVTSCAAPNKMSLEASRTDKKILTDNSYFYYQGKSYKYNTEGAKVIEVLVQDIPEAKFEMESYQKTNDSANFLAGVGFVGIVTGTVFLIVRQNAIARNSAKYFYQKKEETNNNYLIFYGGGFLAGVMGTAEREKAIVSFKKAIMYYNKSINDK